MSIPTPVPSNKASFQERAELARWLRWECEVLPDEAFLRRALWQEKVGMLLDHLRRPAPTGDRVYWSPEYLSFSVQELGKLRLERIAQLLSQDASATPATLNLVVVMLDTVTSEPGLSAAAQIAGKSEELLDELMPLLRSALRLLAPGAEHAEPSSASIPAGR